jgi:integrase
MFDAKLAKIPSYRKHRASGQAVVTLNAKDHYLGRHGTAASRTEYNRKISEWLAAGRQLPANGELTVAGLVKRYWSHVEAYYRNADGTPTGEVLSMKYALRPLSFLYGQTPAKDFGPVALKAVRQLMVDGYLHPRYGQQKPLCRTVINSRIKRIRRMFKWAVANQLVPADSHHALCTLEALKLGRTEARESKPVLPVARAVVEDTLPHLRPMLVDMVLLQLESGMRPGELVIMRSANIDMTGPVWLYTPPKHKTQHHGHTRIRTFTWRRKRSMALADYVVAMTSWSASAYYSHNSQNCCRQLCPRPRLSDD